uniref:NodB homology domain-containing protein n=1 Tax=Ditylenchus dipsaci TaxID=166011 RepID=A0A915EBV7_9BILA
MPSGPQACVLPNCFCSKDGQAPPGNLLPSTVPQFIVLTFDDAVNDPHLFNPNGHPIKATFFISHEWTDYNEVEWIAERGHEIASNSITHASLAKANLTEWTSEMDGQRQVLAEFGNVAEDSIVGMRTPQLAMGGDQQFEMMQRAGFVYDNSMSVNSENMPYCSYPGIWEIPMNQFHGLGNLRSAMVRGAVENDASVEDITNVLFNNFQRAYTTNRAPYVLSLNADFLQLGGGDRGMQALNRFLTNMRNHPDVYFITLKNLVKWMQAPVPLSQISQFLEINDQTPQQDYLQKDSSSRRCATPNKCLYPTPFLPSTEHQFLTCHACPPLFPWLHNPAGLL